MLSSQFPSKHPTELKWTSQQGASYWNWTYPTELNLNEFHDRGASYWNRTYLIDFSIVKQSPACVFNRNSSISARRTHITRHDYLASRLIVPWDKILISRTTYMGQNPPRFASYTIRSSNNIHSVLQVTLPARAPVRSKEIAWSSDALVCRHGVGPSPCEKGLNDSEPPIHVVSANIRSTCIVRKWSR